MSDFSKDYVSREDAAKLIGIDKCTLSRWFGEGIGPPRIKIGRRVLYSKASIERWLLSQEVQPCREA